MKPEWNPSPHLKLPARCTCGIATVAIYRDGGSHRVKVIQPAFLREPDKKFRNLDNAIVHAELTAERVREGEVSASSKDVTELRQTQLEFDRLTERAEALGYKNLDRAITDLEYISDATAPEPPLHFVIHRKLPDIRIGTVCDRVAEEIKLGNIGNDYRDYEFHKLTQFRAEFGNRMAHEVTEPELIRWTANRGSPILSAADFLDIPEWLTLIRRQPADPLIAPVLEAMDPDDLARLLDPAFDYENGATAIIDTCNKVISQNVPIWTGKRLPDKRRLSVAATNALANEDLHMANRIILGQMSRRLLTTPHPEGLTPKTRYEYWLTAAKVMKKAYRAFGAISDRTYNLVRDHELFQAKSGVLFEILEPAQWHDLLIHCNTRSQLLHAYLGAGTSMRVSEIDRSQSSWIESDGRGRPARFLVPDPKGPFKSKGKSYRIVPIRGALREVLIALKPSGRLLPTGNAQPELARISADLGFPWVHNILRRSFLSYLGALIEDDKAVAKEAGNTKDVLKRHYDREADPEKAREFLHFVPPRDLIHKWAQLPA